MPRGASRNVLPLLSMRESQTMKQHSLRATSHTGRKSSANCELSHGNRPLREVHATRARRVPRHETDLHLERSTVVINGDIASTRHADARWGRIKIVLETEAIAHNPRRVKHVGATWHNHNVRNGVALAPSAKSKIDEHDADRLHGLQTFTNLQQS